MTDKEILNIITREQWILRRADEGNDVAQYIVASAYAVGLYEITSGYERSLLEFEVNLDKLLECAEKGWIEAQKYVEAGYRYGWYGLSKDIQKAKDLKKKWKLK